MATKTLNPDQIIGLPPSVRHIINELDSHDEYVLNTMSVMEIVPCRPKAVFGGGKDQEGGGGFLSLFSMDISEGKRKYGEILQSLAKSLGSDNLKKVETPLYVAFLNDAAPGESWNTDYADSKFESIMGFGSETAGELRFITGEETLTESVGVIFNQVQKQVGGFLEDITGGESGKQSKKIRQQIMNAMRYGGINPKGLGPRIKQKAMQIEKALGGYGKILSGSRIDFPMVWKGCSYSPSYNTTIRLYNPMPNNMDSFKEHILEPLSKLLALTVPIADENGSTFYAPLLCKVNCHGLFTINAGYISSCEISKGGDNNDISCNQKPAIVDVRLGFSDLYSTMIANAGESGEQGNQLQDRPTLANYLKNMMEETPKPKITSSGILLEDLDLESTPTVKSSPSSNPSYSGNKDVDETPERTPDKFKTISDILDDLDVV